MKIPTTALGDVIFYCSVSRYRIYATKRDFSSTTPCFEKNRIFDPVRNRNDFSNLLLLSASNRKTLITLWTASYCPSCRVVLPLVKNAIEKDGLGEEEGGIGFAEIEIDAVDMAGLGLEYFINSIPTLLAFSRQEAQLKTKVTDVTLMKDRDFLKQWIKSEALRKGTGGAGGDGLLGGLMKGLFKSGG